MMSSAKTGIWSAFGALAGGLAGAFAGRYAAQIRPRYAGHATAQEVEDAMVVGGATGSVVGAFVAGAISGETAPSQLTP